MNKISKVVTDFGVTTKPVDVSKLDAVIMPKTFGKMIFDKEMTLIIFDKDLSNFIESTLVLISDKKAWGVIKIINAKKLNLDEIKEQKNKHKLSVKKIKDLFGNNTDTLSGYEFRFKNFLEPIGVELPEFTNLLVRAGNYELENQPVEKQSPDEGTEISKPEIDGFTASPRNLKGITDDKLVKLDGRLHELWFENVKEELPEDKELLIAHLSVINELKDRKIAHKMNDAFYRRTLSFNKQVAEKLPNERLNLRPKDFENGKCGLCRYFTSPDQCAILVGPVAEELVCDGFQGKEGFPLYDMDEDRFLDFTIGMESEQPYQHIVIDGVNTPKGPLVIIRDTMKPKPHVFSLSMDFHVLHTSSEHHWTQEEVDRLVDLGRKLRSDETS